MEARNWIEQFQRLIISYRKICHVYKLLLLFLVGRAFNSIWFPFSLFKKKLSRTIMKNIIQCIVGVDEVNNATLPLKEALIDNMRINYHRAHLSFIQLAIK